jgi:hypothetical protein
LSYLSVRSISPEKVLVLAVIDVCELMKDLVLAVIDVCKREKDLVQAVSATWKSFVRAVNGVCYPECLCNNCQGFVKFFVFC